MSTPGTQKSKADSATVTITDPALLRRINLAADRRRKAVDPVFLTKAITRACRIHYGLDNDLTPLEVSRRLDCHLNTVMNYFHQRRFPNAYYQGRGLTNIRIPVADVEALTERTVLLRAA